MREKGRRRRRKRKENKWKKRRDWEEISLKVRLCINMC